MNSDPGVIVEGPFAKTKKKLEDPNLLKVVFVAWLPAHERRQQLKVGNPFALLHEDCTSSIQNLVETIEHIRSEVLRDSVWGLA
ncbi:hypothetical protein CEXT_808271 [Caerostris extrusa]|uniref:ADF-H domain-containing protein n=1 Tax=Caerostris extrusa TaxID=172846 RepID=A0AAV4N7W4_CAEEX|nr:hypothetical protein CEXT_808271 [Caerostris extrusa]